MLVPQAQTKSSDGLAADAAAAAPRHSARDRGLRALLRQRLVILDGAMGTMIQRHRLGEAEFRGARFAGWRSDLRGNNDLPTLTQPRIVAGIHREYLLAGADVICTNTFNSSAVSQADYHMEFLVGELNSSAARLARQVADEVTALTARRRFVAGVLGLMWRAMYPDRSFDIWSSISRDGGRTFSTSLRVSHGVSPVANPYRNDGLFGDDIEDLVLDHDTAHLVWGDSRAGFQGAWYASVRLSAYEFADK